ncbi:MAG: ribosome silencing factor [Candidatus Omnitrophica bacterium]|nr:ribosome silencing factor [Candidatus Omnitrophota bacterium]
MKLVEFSLEEHAKKPVVLDVTDKCGICDYFVICSADTGVQARAICSRILHLCKEHNYVVHHYESDGENRWMLIDLFDVIVHIFTDEARIFYNLEYLWSDAKKVRVQKRKNLV